jgi:hypothetical protein
MDMVHRAVDQADQVHRGPAAIGASPSSSELGLRLLWWSRLSDKGRRSKREARGPGSRLIRARKAARWWGELRCRVTPGSEIGQGGAGEERWEE